MRLRTKIFPPKADPPRAENSMVEIIPSINVRTFEEVKERISKVEPYVKWCHLDVTDGIFSKHLTWHDPRDLLNLETKLNAEVHLMVSEPEKILDQWLVKPIKRIIVHLEAVSDMDLIIKKCREAGVEIGLAINPETFWGKLEPWFGPVRSKTLKASADVQAHRTSNGIDLFQVLAVHPGPSGQEVNWPEILGKIRHIREHCPRCIIEVDGGIDPHTYKNAVSVGANILVAGAYIFNSGDIKIAVENLKNVSST